MSRRRAQTLPCAAWLMMVLAGAGALPPLLAAAALLRAAEPAAAMAAEVSRPPAEISPTIYVGGIQDLRLDGGGQSKCGLLVERAAAYGAFRRAQFLVSQLWWDSGPRNPPPGWTGCDNYTLSTYYCFGRFNATELEHWSYHRNEKTGQGVPALLPELCCWQRPPNIGLHPPSPPHPAASSPVALPALPALGLQRSQSLRGRLPSSAPCWGPACSGRWAWGWRWPSM
jgi:hypothetical protein